MLPRNSLPLRQGMLRRPRLHSLIRKGLQQPLLVMLAGPGYGKTQAMADYLSQCDAKVAWLRLGVLDNLQTHFWDHLIQVLQREFSAAAEGLRTLEFPDTLLKFDAFLRFLANEISREKQVIWVFDDFGEIVDPKVRLFFRMLAEADFDNFRFVLISGELAATDSVAFMTSNLSLILGHDLRFSGDEILDLYRLHGVDLEPDELSEIERYTEGWPLPLHMLVLQRSQMPSPLSMDGRLTHQAISHMFEERFFRAYPERQRKLFVKLSLLDAFTEELAYDLCEQDGVDPKALENHVFIAKEPAVGRFSCHNLYRIFLQKKRGMLDAEEERQLWRKAGGCHASSGAFMEAAACYRRSGDRGSTLNALWDFVQLQHGITPENADYILEHIDPLTPEEARAYPIAKYLRAIVFFNTFELEKAEALLLELERELSGDGSPEARALLGETYAMLGTVHMTRAREDFGDYYRRAAEYLPEGTRLQSRKKMLARNNHAFSIADNRPGARERMERAVHDGVPWATRVLRGGLGGMEHIFSAESAYLSYRLSEAQQHAYRGIYKAEANAQHDLVCNGYCLLARVGLMRGDFAEMTRQVRSAAEYAEKYEIVVLKEIRDTALGWYYMKLRDHDRVPRSVVATNRLDVPPLAQDRGQIVYANYLLHTGEFARLVGMFEHPKGLFLTNEIWPDRICMYIMLAIAHHHLDKPDDAMKALWAAYDLCYHNGLVTLFIEAEKYMCALIGAARRQRTYAFAPDWLDRIDREAAEFSRRAAAVRTAYRKQKNPGKAAKDNPLTRREMEVLRALSRGDTREEIAVEQFISVNTVKTFIRNIYNKLDASNRAEAVSIAISNGYIEVAEASE